MRPRKLAAVCAAAAVGFTMVAAVAHRSVAQQDRGTAQPAIRDAFETGVPRWREEDVPSDATFLLRAHEISSEIAREGRGAEFFAFEAGPGSVLYYSYSLPKIPVSSELRATLFARSNRAGARLYGHVVLPNDKDPDTGRPSFLLVPGSAVDVPDRWQRLELANLPLALERQARVLRAGTQRAVSLEGAYLDRLVVNLYGGAGETEIALDDLVVEPVTIDQSNAPLPPAEGTTNPADIPKGATTAVRLVANHLQRGGSAWLPRGISAPLAEIESLRRAGFDVLEVPDDADPELLRKATELGYALMPRLPWDALESPEDAVARIGSFARATDVAFWSLGRDLGADPDQAARNRELEQVRRLISLLRQGREGAQGAPTLAFGTAADLIAEYALFGRNLDVLAIEPRALGTSADPMATYQYLSLCRALTAARNPNALFWAWLPAAAPVQLRRNVWGDDTPPAWGWPAAQPEQIRLYTYAALMAGYRGIGYRGDVELGRTAGLDRLYELTLLVAEMEIVEEILARAVDPIAQWPAFPPNPQRALVYNPGGGLFSPMRQTMTQVDMREVNALPSVRVAAIDSLDQRTKLLLVADLAAGAQWQPPQMGHQNVNLLIPAPESAQAFEIILGDDVRKLESKRDTGGRRITIPLLNATAMVIVTTDFELIERLRAVVMALRPKVVDLAIKQAELRLQETLQITGALKSLGVAIKDQDDLLSNTDLQSAATFLASARDARDRADYETAWSEARSVALAIRVVMRAHFDRALADFNSAVAKSLTDGQSRPPLWTSAVSCPPLVSATTLPQYYYWRDFVAGTGTDYGRNALPSGNFDDSADAMRQAGWSDASHPQTGFKGSISVDSSNGFAKSPAALKLSVRPAQTFEPDEFLDRNGERDANALLEARRAALDALPPALRWPVAAVRSPSVEVKARDFVRVRVLVRVPQSLPGGGCGLIVQDSQGGELLQFASNEATTGWREVVLYRRIAEAGPFHVTLGYAGLGDAYFDNLRIEILGADQGPPSGDAPDESLAPPLRPNTPSATLPRSDRNPGIRR